MKRILKNIILLVSFSGAMQAYAVGGGFYMGIMGGPATNTASPQESQTASGVPPTVTLSPRSSQFGSRIYMGNMINPYAGVEGGLTYYSTINYKNNSGIETCSDGSARVRSFDLVFKGAYPIASAFDIFVKAGPAYAYENTSGGLNQGVNGQCGKTTHTGKFAPTYSIGADYAMNQNWLVDLTWTRLAVGNNQFGNVDLFAIGFSYHFVNKYCGQFLCDD